MMAAGGPRTWPGFMASQPPKKHRNYLWWQLGGREPSQDSQPPSPPKNKTKKNRQRKKRDGGKTPKASNAAWGAWCGDVTGDSHSMSTQTIHESTPQPASHVEEPCVGRVSKWGGGSCIWTLTNFVMKWIRRGNLCQFILPNPNPNKNGLQTQSFPQVACSQRTASTGSRQQGLNSLPKDHVIFQHVQSVKKSNTIKRRLNTYWQRGRINPDKLEAVSDNEPDDPIPDVSDILDLPQNTNCSLYQADCLIHVMLQKVLK